MSGNTVVCDCVFFSLIFQRMHLTTIVLMEQKMLVSFSISAASYLPVLGRSKCCWDEAVLSAVIRSNMCAICSPSTKGIC